MNGKRAYHQEFPVPPYCKYHFYCFLTFFKMLSGQHIWIPNILVFGSCPIQFFFFEPQWLLWLALVVLGWRFTILMMLEGDWTCWNTVFFITVIKVDVLHCLTGVSRCWLGGLFGMVWWISKAIRCFWLLPWQFWHCHDGLLVVLEGNYCKFEWL